MSALLPLRPALLARIDSARELGRRFLRGTQALGAPGAPPEEFEGHRPYTPGDDVRWVDWNIYARQEEFFVKVFRADEEVEILLLVDASPSMAGGSGLKQQTAAAAAAALARFALLTGHPVRVGRYAERLLELRGPWRSPDDIAAVQRHLGAPPPAGRGTDLVGALRGIITGRQRPMSAFVLTDGFQKAPLIGAVTQALALGVRRACVVRIVDPSDLAPALRGRVELRDAEGEERWELIADAALEARVRNRIAHHFLLLGEGLARIGASLHELRIDRPFEDAFLAMLRRSEPASAPHSS